MAREPATHPRGANELIGIQGDPDVGKSLLTIDLAARLTTGGEMPDRSVGGSPMNVLLISYEDGLADTIVGRCEAAGANRSRIFAPTDTGLSIPNDLNRLEAMIHEHEIGAVFVDPLAAELDESVRVNNDQSVRRALAPCHAIADATRASFCLVRHPNKSDGTNPKYRGGGSIGITGAFRAEYLFATHPLDDNRVVLAPIKTNLAPKGATPSLAAEIVSERAGPPRLHWLGTSDYSAAQLLAAGEPDDPQETNEIQDWLKAQVAEGPVAATVIFSKGEELGFSKKQLRKASKKVGLESDQIRASGGQADSWNWFNPDLGSLDSQLANRR